MKEHGINKGTEGSWVYAILVILDLSAAVNTIVQDVRYWIYIAAAVIHHWVSRWFFLLVFR